MKATEANLLSFLEGKKQFLLPIYQRTYSWEKKQCEQLWRDILSFGQADAAGSHFLGAAVYIHEGHQRSPNACD